MKLYEFMIDQAAIDREREIALTRTRPPNWEKILLGRITLKLGGIEVGGVEFVLPISLLLLRSGERILSGASEKARVDFVESVLSIGLRRSGSRNFIFSVSERPEFVFESDKREVVSGAQFLSSAYMLLLNGTQAAIDIYPTLRREEKFLSNVFRWHQDC